MKRRALVLCLGGLGLVGIALATVPFLKSLAPNDRSRSNLYSVDIADLGVGQFKVVERNNTRIFVMHLAIDYFTVLSVPVKDGAVVMPDLRWWRPAGLSRDFGPDQEGGVLTEGARFTCRDVAPERWPEAAWLWNVSGRYIGPTEYLMDDMPVLRHTRVGSQLMLRIS
jgi:hypothetical protein